MLKTKKSITLTGNSVIDGVVVAGYQAVINSDDPNDMNISSWQQDKAMYTANRSQCRQDEAEFEDTAYALQDELLAEKQSTADSE
ncbi:MAG: hypothetical protein SOX32_05535 [Candidatus Choladocola sp.]|nr:hypothetical protein [Candidatus Choladocola sp.]